MIFQVEVDDKLLWQRIIEGDGDVTATGRRLIEGEYFDWYNTKGKDEWWALYHPDKQLLPLPHQTAPKKRVKYYITQSHALQPGRGKPGVWYRRLGAELYTQYQYAHIDRVHGNPKTYWEFHGGDNAELEWNGFHPARIRITSLKELDVRQMTDAQAQRTGFASAGHYLEWWCRQYDKKVNLDAVDCGYTDAIDEPFIFKPNLTALPSLLKHRPTELYTMLYIGFEFVGAA